MSKLTTRRIDTEKPTKGKDKRIADGLGLYLKVAGNGTKTFVYRYSYATGRHEMSLGSYPESSLAQAREARLVQSRVLESGRNPILVQQIARTAKREALNVNELIQEFYTNYLKHHYEKPDDALSTLRRDIGSELGKYLVPDVTKKDCTRAISKIVQRGSKVAANRTLTLSRRMFEYAVDQEMIENNPVVLKRSGAGGKEKSRTTHLSFDGIRHVLSVLNDPAILIDDSTRSALLFLMATSKRPGEVATMEWAHVDLDKGIWINPRILTKEKRDDHTVFLSAYAVDVLRKIGSRTGSGRHVFRSPKYADRHIDRHSMSRAVLRLVKDGTLKSKFTPHDFRRTFSTRMGDLGVPLYVIEKVLDHVMIGVQQVYNHSSFFQERQDAMNTWGLRLEELSKC